MLLIPSESLYLARISLVEVIQCLRQNTDALLTGDNLTTPHRHLMKNLLINLSPKTTFPLSREVISS